MKPEKKQKLAGSIHYDSKTLRWLTLTVFFTILFLNLLLLTKNYYWDGVFFAQLIEDAPQLNSSLIHPNHLLYLPFEYLIYRAVRWAGFAGRALTILQITSCFFSAATAIVFFRINLKLFKSLYTSLTLTALFAFSAMWWKFSTDANAYVLAVLLLLVCFCLVLPERQPRPFALALVHALAMFAHQLSVFFFAVAIAGLVFQSRTKVLKHVVKYAATVILLTAGVYFFSFYLVTGTFAPGRFVSWTTYFSPEHGFTLNAWSNLVYTLRSQGRVFFGGRLSFIRDLGGPLILGLAGVAALAVLTFLFALFRHPRELKSAIAAALPGPRQFRALTILCAVWIAIYIVFLFFFIPQNTFYRLFYLAPIVLLGGTLLNAAGKAQGHVRRYRAALFVVAMFCANLAFSQYPYTQVRANPPLELALKLNQVWRPGTTVYFALPNSDESLIRYFNPATVWVQANPESFRQDISQLPPRGGNAWLETTLIDAFQQTPEGKSWLEAHASRRADCELVNPKYRIEFWQLNPESFANR